MKHIREINQNLLSRIFIPLFAVLFVFSISAHNHQISVDPDSSLHISGSITTVSHSFEDCPACLLHGNIKPPRTDTVINLVDPGQSIAFTDTGYLIPASFLTLNKPSRSPPLV